MKHLSVMAKLNFMYFIIINLIGLDLIKTTNGNCKNNFPTLHSRFFNRIKLWVLSLRYKHGPIHLNVLFYSI